MYAGYVNKLNTGNFNMLWEVDTESVVDTQN